MKMPPLIRQRRKAHSRPSTKEEIRQAAARNKKWVKLNPEKRRKIDHAKYARKKAWKNFWKMVNDWTKEVV